MQKIIILGPTGIGKSAYAIKMAKEIDADIVSVDSMQVYKYLDIGTAKLTPMEMQGIKHYMIDIVEPTVQYSVVDYLNGVKEILGEHEKGDKNLIFCGGTGLYLNALMNGLNFPVAQRNDELRARLEEQEKTLGKQFLWDELLKTDPEAAAKIHPNDSYRTKRALEVFYLTGKKFSEQATKSDSVLGDNYKVIGLTAERELLYKHLDGRVDKMLAKGLVAEVKSLLEKYSPACTALQALGYKEIVGFLQNHYNLEAATEKIKQGTRNFAKRQYTWYRAFKNVEWQEVELKHA